MQRTPFRHGDVSGLITVNELNVMSAYDDFEAGKRANEAYNFLTQTIGHNCRFTHQTWKLDLLAVPRLREMATQDAKEANIIILSLSAPELRPLPRAWMDTWATGSSQVFALIALLKKQAEEDGFVQATEGYLRKAVAGTQIAFFEHPSDMAIALRKPAWQADWRRRTRALPPMASPRQWAEQSQIAAIE